jgi:hypothetical protein
MAPGVGLFFIDPITGESSHINSALNRTAKKERETRAFFAVEEWPYIRAS